MARCWSSAIRAAREARSGSGARSPRISSTPTARGTHLARPGAVFTAGGALETTCRGCDRGRESRAAGDHAGLARALDAERVQRRRSLDVVDLDGWDLGRIRHEELHEGRVAELTFVVVSEALVESATNALSDAALDLAFHHQWVDQSTAVVDDHVLEDLEPVGLGVYPHIRRVAARRPRPPDRAEVPTRLQTSLLARAQRRSPPRPGRAFCRRLPAAPPPPPAWGWTHRDPRDRDRALRAPLHP